MGERVIDLLLLDDSEEDAEVIGDIIESINVPRVNVKWAESIDDFKSILDNRSFDIIFSDLNLPGSRGIETLKTVNEIVSDIPIVVLTGLEDETLGMNVIDEGAQSYLVKSDLHPGEIKRAILFSIERYGLSRQLRASEKRFNEMVDKNVDGILIIGFDKILHYANKAALELLGKSLEQVKGQTFDYDFTSSDSKEVELLRDDGTTVVVELRNTNIMWWGIEVHLISMRDITERKRMESALIESKTRLQKAFEEKMDGIKKAQGLQEKLNTAVLPNIPTINIEAVFMPCEELGGDSFTVMEGSDGSLVLILSDCTGHGIEASMSATLLKTILDQFSWLLTERKETHAFLEMVNRTMVKYTPPGQMPTVFVAVIEPQTNTMYYSNANGVRPFIIRDGELVRFEKPKGFFIGLDENVKYEMKSARILEGDEIALFSDAMIELFDKDDNLLDAEIAMDILRQLKGGVVDDGKKVISSLRTISGGFPLSDDLTLILLENIKPFQMSYALEDKDAFKIAYDEIHGRMKYLKYTDSDLENAKIALDELVDNALKHGPCEQPYSVELLCSIDCSKAIFTISGCGEGFRHEMLLSENEYENLAKELDENELKEYIIGRGISRARAHSKELEFDGGGKNVTFTIERTLAKTVFLYHQSDVTSYLGEK